MYTIQLNEKGSHNLQITAKNLETIDRYALFRDLVDSHGYVNEAVYGLHNLIILYLDWKRQTSTDEA